jgi:hypothetical protein
MSVTTLREIGDGIFAFWKVNRPKIIERILPRKQIVKKELLIDYKNVYFQISLIDDTIIFEKIVDENRETVADIFEKFNMTNYRNKSEFRNDFISASQNAVSDLHII